MHNNTKGVEGVCVGIRVGYFIDSNYTLLISRIISDNLRFKYRQAEETSR